MSWQGIFGVAVASYLLVVAGVYFLQRSILYQPSASLPSPSAAGVAEMRPLILRAGDGLELTSWYKEADPGRHTIVLFHGNGGNLAHRAWKVRPWLDAGFGVLLVGYRGYGGNPGSPSEAGLFADGRAAIASLAARKIPRGRIVLFGESLGSGIAVKLAREAADSGPYAAIILEAAYTSITDVAATHYPFLPVRWLLKDRFESLSRIKGLNSPLFAIHGEKDTVIPFRFGLELYGAADGPKQKQWFPRGDHNDLYAHGAGKAVMDFLQALPAVPE
jgi:hypothetical protein